MNWLWIGVPFATIDFDDLAGNESEFGGIFHNYEINNRLIPPNINVLLLDRICSDLSIEQIAHKI